MSPPPPPLPPPPHHPPPPLPPSSPPTPPHPSTLRVCGSSANAKYVTVARTFKSGNDSTDTSTACPTFNSGISASYTFAFSHNVDRSATAYAVCPTCKYCPGLISFRTTVPVIGL